MHVYGRSGIENAVDGAQVGQVRPIDTGAIVNADAGFQLPERRCVCFMGGSARGLATILLLFRGFAGDDEKSKSHGFPIASMFRSR